MFHKHPYGISDCFSVTVQDLIVFTSYFAISRFASLHTAISVLSSRGLAENGHRIAKALSTASIRMWGWLALLGPRAKDAHNSSNMDNGSLNSHGKDLSFLTGDNVNEHWQPVFVALTDRDLLLYDAVPWSIDGWTKPNARIPLLMTR